MINPAADCASSLVTARRVIFVEVFAFLCGDGDGKIAVRNGRDDLEAVNLYGFGIETQAILLVGEEFLDILALVALELDHLSHLGVGDDGAIAGKLLLDHFKDLLLVEFLGQALDRGQRLTTIALYGMWFSRVR